MILFRRTPTVYIKLLVFYGRRTQGIGKVIQNAEDDIISEETRIKKGEKRVGLGIGDLGLIVPLTYYHSSIYLTRASFSRAGRI